MKTRRSDDLPRPTEAVPAPWSVPQVRKIIAWMAQSPMRCPRCPRHGDVKPALVIMFSGFACEEDGCTFVQTWAMPDAFRCDALEETREEMQARVKQWNAKCPDGTPVDYDRDDAWRTRAVKTHTRSRAYIDLKLGPVVLLYNVDGPVPLNDIEPRKDRKPKSVEQECMRIA